jgi:hypothetical protein
MEVEEDQPAAVISYLCLTSAKSNEKPLTLKIWLLKTSSALS